MTEEIKGNYRVYRLTVAEAAAMFAKGMTSDPAYANRPIAFYFADQRLASPPSSDARNSPPTTLLSDARNSPPTTLLSDARNSPPTTLLSDARNSPSTTLLSDARKSPTLSERPTEEAGRGLGVPIGRLLEIEDPQERQMALRKRALDVGNRVVGTWMDLSTLIGSEFPEVRRLAASAMKKRLEGDPSIGRAFFQPLIRALVRETYPQVQQYMLSALKRCATSADQGGIDYLKDVARDPTLSTAFREAANEIVHGFETHHRLKESVHRHWCHRCKRPITKEESAAGLEKYGKPYCRRCLDERLLGDVNFENMVDVAKRRRTTDGVAVQSKGEKRIADWLVAHGIPYEYDERFRIVEDTTIRPDFYLREFDLYIEYWGMNTERYNANRRKKHELYQREGRKLISLGYEDDSRLEERLFERLSLHIPLLGASTEVR